MDRLVSVPLLSGLPGDAEDVGDLSPRVAHETHLIHGASDVAVDVVPASDERLEAGGTAAVGHASRLVDGPEVRQDLLTDDLETGGLDGLHHLWCKHCHPDWDASPIGPGVGNPFTAWCGTRAVILARWMTDEMPPGACRDCNDPARPCAACGAVT